MKKSAPFLVLAAGILWGMMGIYVRKLAGYGMETMEIVALRSLLTAACLFIFMLLFKRDMLRLRIKDIWCFTGTGILSIVFFNFCYFKAITLTSLSIAAVLLYTAPTIVMILSAILFKEKITVVKVIALIATFFGCLMVTGVFGSSFCLIGLEGLLTGLGAGLGYALYSIFSRYAIERGYHSLTISFYTFLIAAIGTVPMVNFKIIYEVCLVDKGMIFYYFLFALLTTILPYILYTKGLADLENSKAAIIASVEPVTASVIGIIIYHEKMPLNIFVGIVLILGAILVTNLKTKGRKNKG